MNLKLNYYNFHYYVITLLYIMQITIPRTFRTGKYVIKIYYLIISVTYNKQVCT